MEPSGQYASLDSFKDSDVLNIRYDRIRKVAVFKVGAARKKAASAPKATAEDSFEDWMKKIDRLCVERTGMSYSDFADIDYAGLYEAGTPPAEVIRELLVQ